MILLDTNVISELLRERPDAGVRAWLRGIARSEFWTASIVIAELLAGIEQMAAGQKQKALREAVEAMITEDFKGQVLKVDIEAARHYGQITARRRSMGRPIREMDALIAATARKNGAILATRNVTDFEDCGIQVVNPWNAK